MVTILWAVGKLYVQAQGLKSTDKFNEEIKMVLANVISLTEKVNEVLKNVLDKSRTHYIGDAEPALRRIIGTLGGIKMAIDRNPTQESLQEENSDLLNTFASLDLFVREIKISHAEIEWELRE